MSDGIKSAFTIQAMNAFVIGAMTILVPLLMVERGIDVESMGLIFAILPIVSQTARIMFGVVSDFVGRKIFYKLNSVLNVVFMMVYYFANQPLDFLLGKVAEGIRNASLWSVNRAYITDNSYEKQDLLIKMSGLGSIFSAFGTISAGLLISMLLYENTILACVLVALFIIPQTFKLRDRMKKEVSILSILKAFDIRKRNKTFKNFIIIFFFSGLGWGLISGYIMPLFLRIMGYNSRQIGLVLGVRGLGLGLITYFIASRFPDKKLILFGGMAFAMSTALLSFSTAYTAFLLVILTGFAEGLVSAGFEVIFLKVSNQRTFAGDVGMMMFGLNLGMSISLAVSGFVIKSIGFPTMFFVSAMLFVMYSMASYYNLQ